MKNKNEYGLSWREEAVYKFLLEATDGIITREIYTNVPMAKATALKSLAVLEAKDLVIHEMVGPAKTWHTKRKCENCEGSMTPHIIYRCEHCNKNLYMLGSVINIMGTEEDRWDNIYGALQNLDAYEYLREKGFLDENGLTEEGANLKQKMEDIYGMC